MVFRPLTWDSHNRGQSLENPHSLLGGYTQTAAEPLTARSL